jgi:cytochrome c oxidase subunit IV
MRISPYLFRVITVDNENYDEVHAIKVKLLIKILKGLKYILNYIDLFNFLRYKLIVMSNLLKTDIKFKFCVV